MLNMIMSVLKKSNSSPHNLQIYVQLKEIPVSDDGKDQRIFNITIAIEYVQTLLRAYKPSILKHVEEYAGSSQFHDVIIKVVGNSKNVQTGMKRRKDMVMETPFDDNEHPNERHFYGHKIILASQSLVFKNLFNSGMNESRRRKVTIRDVNPNTFEMILYFIYSSKFEPEDVFDAMDLVIVAHQLKMEKLCSQAFAYLEEQISFDNLWFIWKYAVNEVIFYNAVLSWRRRILDKLQMKRDISKISGSPKSNHSRRREISLATDEYLEEKQNIEELFCEMIHCIRFPNMDTYDLVSLVEENETVMQVDGILDLLTEAYRYKISPERTMVSSRCFPRNTTPQC
ncbi:BTB/POZ protein [Spinellus fusiger]|nr:BTB/POZ protein [Spinellus fusiger]